MGVGQLPSRDLTPGRLMAFDGPKQVLVDLSQRKVCFRASQTKNQSGGGRGIRTPGTVSGTVVFKTTRFNRSRIPPCFKINDLEKCYCVLLSGHCTLNHSIISPWTSASYSKTIGNPASKKVNSTTPTLLSSGDITTPHKT